MGGAGIKKFLAWIKGVKLGINQNIHKEKEFKLYELVKQEKPDRIVYHSKNIYPLLWEYYNRGKTIFISPFPYFHYVKGHPFFGMGKGYGEYFNRLTFKIYDFGVVKATMMARK